MHMKGHKDGCGCVGCSHKKTQVMQGTALHFLLLNYGKVVIFSLELTTTELYLKDRPGFDCSFSFFRGLPGFSVALSSRNAPECD